MRIVKQAVSQLLLILIWMMSRRLLMRRRAIVIWIATEMPAEETGEESMSRNSKMLHVSER